MAREHRFSDAPACADALAKRIAALAQSAIATRGETAMIVSGGKTPLPFFERLRALDIEWQRVKLSLSDERWVPAGDPASNENSVREHLLRGPAAAARFIGLKNHAPSASAGAEFAWARLGELRRPFDAMLLGMGEDGHTASLFPQSPELERALDPGAAPACIATRAPVAPHERLSLNLAALLDSQVIFILIAGAEKWRVYERAAQGTDATEMPVRAVLRQEKVPVEVYWSD